MELHPIGDSGVEISTVGLGGGPIGNLFAPMTDDDADLLLHAAVDRGVRYFDTAPLYGMGWRKPGSAAHLLATDENGWSCRPKSAACWPPTRRQTRTCITTANRSSRTHQR